MHGSYGLDLGVLITAGACLLGAPGCVAETTLVTSVSSGSCGGSPSPWHVLATARPLDVDVLLVIDDSGSMLEEQAALTASFASFVDMLDPPWHTGSYRIAVTTTSGGAGCEPETGTELGTLRFDSCRSRPEAFVSDGAEGAAADVRQDACHAICPEAWASLQTLPTSTQGDDVPRPRPWIERIGDRTNLPEGLTPQQALQCIGPQGIGGCRFESPLEAMRRAVLRSYVEGDPNFGFIREHAVLMIVFVTDEADCSLDPQWADGVLSPDGERVFWSDPEAPTPTSAACWNAGVACDEANPRSCRAVDLDEAGEPVATDDAEALAVLHPLGGYVELLEQITANKDALFPGRRVVVSVLGGILPNGTVSYENGSDPTFVDEFGIGPGCESMHGRAAPPVRLRELTEALGLERVGVMFSLCNADYSNALSPISPTLGCTYRPGCMPGCIADADPSTPDVLDPACELVQDVPDLEIFADYEDQAILPCEDDGSLPVGRDVCYVALTGHDRSEECIYTNALLEFQIVRRPGVYVPLGTQVRASCAVSPCVLGDCPEQY